jgi:hypothetical protein
MNNKPTPLTTGKFTTKSVVIPAQRVKMLDPETGLVTSTEGYTVGQFVTKSVVVPAQRVKMHAVPPALRITFDRTQEQTVQQGLEIAAQAIMCIIELAKTQGLDLEYSQENAEVVEGRLIVNLIPIGNDKNNAEMLRNLIHTLQTRGSHERLTTRYEAELVGKEL